MAHPLVSIITPSYNQVEYLELTIRSVLIQDYPHLEYFVVDGGSNDGSADVIRKYTAYIDWWISESDRGQADAINKGILRAQGEIIAWLNSDDLYRPGTISRAVACLEKHPDAAFVFANATSIDAHGRPFNDLIFKPIQIDDLVGFRMICQPAVFMRKKALAQAGFLDLSYKYLLDHQLWIRLAQTGTIVHVPEFWAYARHHPAAKNVSSALEFGSEALTILEWSLTNDDVADRLRKPQRWYKAGAQRFNARYLLDGGHAGRALRAYYQAFRMHPATALAEWHRIVYAALSLIGLKALGPLYYRVARKRLPSSARADGLDEIHPLYESGRIRKAPTTQ